jgi:hypothetical protein
MKDFENRRRRNLFPELLSLHCACWLQVIATVAVSKESVVEAMEEVTASGDSEVTMEVDTAVADLEVVTVVDILAVEA